MNVDSTDAPEGYRAVEEMPGPWTMLIAELEEVK